MNGLSITLHSKDEIERFNETVAKSFKKSDLSFKSNIPDSEHIYIWGLTSSIRNFDFWQKISIHDYVIFYVNNFIYISRIEDKIRNKDIAGILWSKCHTYPESFELLLLFTKMICIPPSNKDYKKFKPRNSVTRNSITLINNIEIEFPNLSDLFKSKPISKYTYNKYQNEIVAVDYKEPPGRSNYFTRRIIRDTPKAIELKEKYNYRCQICNYVIEIKNQKYAEVHHVWPLGEGGLDNFDNMIVLCPNHHAEFDLCYIAIDPEDGLTIQNKDHLIKGKINLLKSHKLNKLNLKYHFTKFKTI